MECTPELVAEFTAHTDCLSKLIIQIFLTFSLVFSNIQLLREKCGTEHRSGHLNYCLLWESNFSVYYWPQTPG